MKKIVKVLFAVLLLFGVTAKVQADEHYPYTITFKGGMYSAGGEVLGTITVAWDEEAGQYVLSAADFHSFDDLAASTNPVYEFRGWHIAGIEGIVDVTDQLIVHEDMTFVPVYGAPGKNVAYTVSYINAEDGKSVKADKTFHGTEGDDIVVALQYVEKFIPQEYKMAKKLGADASKNVFKFEYRPKPEPEPEVK